MASRIPSVDELSRSGGLVEFPPAVRVDAARIAVAELREQALLSDEIEFSDFESLAYYRAAELTSLRTVPAINMSGVLLHTGLGRARLAPSAVDAVAAVAASHSVVELDLETGRRGSRIGHVEDLLCELTGAEAAFVVNNCAGAVFLTLAALCGGREVVLSRGQMVEIGGAFRMPDIVRESGCRLVEVGCTNKTRLTDFESVVSEDTAAFLRCHPSNFKIVGFSESPSAAELSELARRSGLILIDDVGSGCLVDTTQFGLERERTLRDAITDGADVVMASGDKLLGGPQAGIILGRWTLIDAIARHPLARALRIDKLTLAALEATLRIYREGREDEIPLLGYASRSLDEVKGYAERLCRAYPGASEVVETETEVGGGSMPGSGIKSFSAALATESPDELARALRLSNPPVICRVKDQSVLLDPRSAEDEEVSIVCGLLEGFGGF